MRWLSMSVTFRRMASEIRSPPAYAVIRMARCLTLRIDSRNCVTSSALRITGSLRGTFDIGISSIAQSRLSVTAYRGTQLLEFGTDVRTIQLLLGNRSLATTSRYLKVATSTVCVTTSPFDRL
ncbi:hypothetical protein WS71_23140 [Burkholderia mayonis]|uniref:Uncharacterized protein n=1 Tax=Burkholderia mayonis TaxID=1385591 RepID=A0A1B4G2J9_9BURK|nr:hypothetical protein WS71_23140 [Burkholderia mayonis]KVE51442.1 hypothetical protein WS71_12205 [Burkholderia mayonis]